MPGINIISDFNQNLNLYQSSIRAAQSSEVYNDKISHVTIVSDNISYLGYSKYESYPVELMENERYYICLEGKIFERPGLDLKNKIFELADYAFSTATDSKTAIIQWLRNTEGEFVILIVHKKTHEMVILNDIFGRLPLYYYNNDRILIVTREIKFIIPFLDKITFDRTGIAEYLLFRYALGKRTLLKDVVRLQSATLLKINPLERSIELHRLFEFNYESKSNKNKCSAENAEKLAELFIESCKLRSSAFNSQINVVSLSGGLDSRAVSAGLHFSGIPFSCATYLDFSGKSQKDVQIAEIIAKTIGCEWRLVPLGPPRGQQLLDLLSMKDGQNYLAMGFILEFFEHLQTIYGRDFAYFTGDGGDKVLLNLRPRIHISSLNDLADYIIHNNSNFSLSEIEKITGVHKEEIIEDLTRILMEYPESDFNQKYVHFLFSERAFKWLFEGEDRNRFYFRTSSPFYSIRFFDYAMNCPDEQKHYHSLYRQFLNRISPSLCEINNSNWGFSLQSKRVYLLDLIMQIYERIPHHEKMWLKNHIPGHKKQNYLDLQEGNAIKICIYNQIDKCPSIGIYLSPQSIKNLIVGELNLSRLYLLLTIISYLELLECQSSSLTRFGETDPL
jgi:asparagine synthase (glutamine-hydrolysing)